MRITNLALLLALCAFSAPKAGAQEVIKMGEVNPYSGPLAIYGIEVTRGHEIAVDEANADGGVLGKKIELIRGDATNPQQGIAVAERLATRDNVDLFVGTYMSAVSNSASDTALRYNRLYWETNATMQELTDRGLPNFVRTGPSAGNFAIRAHQAIADVVAPAFGKSEKDLKIWIQHEDFSFGTSIAQKIESLLKEGGIEPVGVASHSYKAIDLNDSVLRIKQAAPDLLVFVGYVPDGNLLLKNMRDQGYQAPAIMFVGMGDTQETLEPNGAEGLEGLLSVSYPRPDLPESYSPNGRHYAEAYRKKYGEDPVASLGMTAYFGFNLLVQAINEAGSTDMEAVRAAAAKMDLPFGTFPGGYGVKFDENFQNTRALPVVIQWQSGEPVTVYPEAAREEGVELKNLPH